MTFSMRILRILFGSVALSSLVLLLCPFAGVAEPTPVLLVYGFQPIPGFRATQLWETMAETLSGNDIVTAQAVSVAPGHSLFHLPAVGSDHRDVFISDYALAYEPTMRDLLFYADRLSDEITWITEQMSVKKIDVVGHSLGGLIARAYIEIDDFTDVIGAPGIPDYGIEYGGEIRTLITIATPHHGMYLAGFGQWLNTLARQLAPGSEFLSLLNRDVIIGDRVASLHPDVRYVSMAGQTCFGCGLRRDETACLRECVHAGIAWHGSDLVVLMASAYLPEGENIACIGMDHVDMRVHPAVCSMVADLLAERGVPPVLYGDPTLQFDEGVHNTGINSSARTGSTARLSDTVLR